MLGKLIKYEFRATGRIMLPLLCVLLLLSVFAGLSIQGLQRLESMGFLGVFYTLTLIAFFLSLFAVSVVALVLMIQRFYRSLLRDEGYLSMTLPVSVDEHILSRLLVSFVWFALVGLLSVLAMGLMLLIGTRLGFRGQFDLRVYADFFSELFSSVGGGNTLLLCLELLLLAFLSSCAVCLRCYAAMGIGCSAPGHKLLLSFAAYFGISFFMSLVGNGLMTVLMPHVDSISVEWDTREEFVQALGIFHGALWIAILAAALACMLFYFVTRWFLKNRLNLA